MNEEVHDVDVEKNDAVPLSVLEQKRLKTLLSYSILDTAGQEEFDGLADLACLTCDVPVCIITFIDQKRLWIKSSRGTQLSEIDRRTSFCQYTILQGSVFEIEDVSLDDRFRGNDLLNEQPDLRFYAGYPLTDPAGYPLGAICVLDNKVRKLTEVQSKSLQLIASQVMALVTYHKERMHAGIQRQGNDNAFIKEKTSSEEKLKSFFESSQGLMCTHDLDGNFTAVNSVGADLLGYTVEEFLKMNLLDVTPQKHRQGLRDYFQQITNSGKSSGLMTTVHKDGRQVIWSYRNALVMDGNGHGYVVGNCIDITQMHNQAKELLRTQQMLMQTSLIAGIGGWEYNLNEKELYWSDLASKIYQQDPDLKLNLDNVLNLYKDGESREKVIKAIADATNCGTAHDIEVQIITGKHEERWVRLVVNAEFRKGKCKKLYGTVQDIDEKKKTALQVEHTKEQLSMQQARLLAFVEHIPAVVAMLDNDIRYLAVSRKWEQEYGLRSQDIIGISHYDVFTDTDQEWKDIHRQALAGKRMLRGEQVSRPDGWSHDRYLTWEVWPWFQFDGAIGGIITLIQDVTEIELHRQELKTARHLAEQANMAKSEFLANMSHEIRTPLNGVIGFTDLVLKTHMSDTQKQYLSFVHQSANTLLSIINDILDFSKIEAGKLELDIDKYDIYEIAAQTADIISFQVQNKGLEMLLDIPACLPQYVWVDDIRLKQVLINLLSNAAKFTECGEIELKIEILDYRPENDDMITCRFIVRDTGIGIRKEKKAKIFEAFLQEDGSTTKRYGGTGLGLTISNQLLALMGSSLHLDSAVGVGSTLYFDLTMKSEPGDINPNQAITNIERVLIVDDNTKSRQLIERMLDQLGIKSDQAENGAQALDILSADTAYNVALIDYHMLHMDGLETVRRIRQTLSAAQLPIILLNSSADDAVVLRASQELHINSRLMKPIKLGNIALSLANLSPDEPQQQTPAAAEEQGFTSKALNILVAEDHLINMILAKTVIKKLAVNATIWEAANGLEALALCQKQLPDLIFMDIQMPLMNGHEATSQIRKLPGADKVPIVALTAGNVMGEKERCLEAGMDDFVAKPFVQNAIWQVFERFLDLNDHSK
ncbi:response regulator [Dyadobacter chenhuakuii]|uniref:Sensory/regulatory protein RpfC n=1 Tax=Dyadobacter chenhuakuii TaxID=2909339 RepID=A0A9X1QGH7_9BACT|nr:response regulator [Dyadobacter chenhuakuii]MCF2501493.1 response regulator [Dyadobacter chenhuakuii]